MWPTLPSRINEHNQEKPSGAPVFINNGIVGSTRSKDNFDGILVKRHRCGISTFASVASKKKNPTFI